MDGETVDTPAEEPGISFSPAFLEEYRPLRELGRGAMGTVFLMEQIRLKRNVAVKVLHAGSVGSEDVKRLIREAQVLARMTHPSILAVHDVGIDSERAYMVCEWVEGGSLGDLLKNGSRLPFERAIRVLTAILEGLEAAHLAGVVHRDLKPANIFLNAMGAPKIGDFGIARAQGLASGMTLGHISGTPAYMSPEQCRGQAAVPPSDLYSMGVILYEMLAGRRPFRGPDLPDFLYQHTNQPAPRLAEVWPEAPPTLEAVVERALRKDPAERFRDAREFLEMLQVAAQEVRARGVATASLDGPTTSKPIAAVTPREVASAGMVASLGGATGLSSSGAGVPAPGGGRGPLVISVLLFLAVAGLLADRVMRPPGERSVVSVTSAVAIPGPGMSVAASTPASAAPAVAVAIPGRGTSVLASSPPSAAAAVAVAVSPAATASPTASPTPAPPASPEPEPTPSPTPEPTATPSPTPTPTATPPPPSTLLHRVRVGYIQDPDGDANVRAGPDTTHDVVARAGRDQWVLVLAQEGDWIKVLISKDVVGYVHHSRVIGHPGEKDVDELAVVDDPDGYSNLRSGPSTGGEVLSRVDSGTIVMVLERGAWCRVRAKAGRDGYLHESRLRPVEIPR